MLHSPARRKEENNRAMIDNNEIQIARECIDIALRKGADAARVSLNKCVSDTVTLLNGNIDKVTHSEDRSLYF